MTNKNFLVVPMHLDALYLSEQTKVAEGDAHFERLPYSTTNGDINPDTPYISETLATQPFSDEVLYLNPGIHLHWALPDTLTHGQQTTNELDFPIAPNRWLIIKTVGTGNDAIVNKWVVESDYLHPDNAESPGSITYPYIAKGRTRPYTYLGRVRRFDDWSEDAEGDYLMDEVGKELTAIGYGHHNFAGYYPNCHSVFGFQDTESIDTATTHTYEVLGWYSDINNTNSKDHLRTFLKDLSSDTDKLNAIKDQLQWNILNQEATPIVPDASLYYAKITIAAGKFATANPRTNATNTKISVGNTGTEALSAYLASRMTKGINITTSPKIEAALTNAQKTIEKQIEGVLLLDDTNHQQLDQEADFLEVLHDKGFNKIDGGTTWTIRSQSNASKRSNAAHAQDHAQITLPDVLAEKLNKLNALQYQYDQTLAEINARQKQLYADWYKYQVAKYPPADQAFDYPEIGLIEEFIREKDLFPLREQLKAVQNLQNQINQVHNELKTDITNYNRLHTHVQLVLQTTAAPRYYEPNDPVVLFTGEALERSRRHGQNGLLGCVVVKDQTIAALRNNLSLLTTISNPLAGFTAVAHYTRNEQPWNPLALEWEAEVFPLGRGFETTPQGNYASAYIQDNYSLAGTDIDLMINGDVRTVKSAKIFSGRTNLSPEASLVTLDKLQNYFRRVFSPSAFEKTRPMRANLYLIMLHRWDQDPNINARLQDFYDSNSIAGDERQTIANLRRAMIWYIQQVVDIANYPASNKYRTANPAATINDAYFQTSTYSRLVRLLAWHLSTTEEFDIESYFSANEISSNAQGTYLDTRANADALIDAYLLTNAVQINGFLFKTHESAQLFIKTFEDATSKTTLHDHLNQTYHVSDITTQSNLRAYFKNTFSPSAFEKTRPMRANLYLIMLHRWDQDPNINARLQDFYDSNSIAGDERQTIANLRRAMIWYIQQVVDIANYPASNKYRTANPAATINDAYFQTSTYSRLVRLLAWHLSTTEEFDIESYFSANEISSNAQGTYLDTRANADALIDAYLLTNAVQINGFLFKTHESARLFIRTFEDSSKPKTLNSNLSRAYRMLRNNMHAQSQSLGGFNEALLMHKSTLSLGIDDPLGFEDEQDFVAMVKNALAGTRATLTAPQPLEDFLPIRDGEMRLLRLRLIDTFGQTNEQISLSDDNPIVGANSFTGASRFDRVKLAPRLSQPARLNFRWLAARNSLEEFNQHPATSPICGWVLPNYLDDVLDIYDQDGVPLGIIRNNATWGAFPGSPDPVLTPDDIPNEHLHRMVNYLLNQGSTFLEDFIATIQRSLLNIEPEYFSRHQDTAVLVGRPLALVRAKFDLELQGLPAYHQGWNTFRQDLRSNFRRHDDFTKVKFPIRLGEYHQLNDGVVGYWKEIPEGSSENLGNSYENNWFYAPEIAVDGQGNIRNSREGVNLEQAIDDPPTCVSLLVDVQGVIHATCGIVPTKVIEIPMDQYRDALARMVVALRTMPVLTPKNAVTLTLPHEPGYQWNWIEQQGTKWNNVPLEATVQQNDFEKTFGAEKGAQIWNLLVDTTGWLQLKGEETGYVLPTTQRAMADLDTKYSNDTGAIEQILARYDKSKQVLSRQKFIDKYVATISGADAKEALSVWNSLITSGRLTNVTQETANTVVSNTPTFTPALSTPAVTAIEKLLQNQATITQTDFISAYNTAAAQQSSPLSGTSAANAWTALTTANRLVRKTASIVASNTPALPTNAGTTLTLLNNQLNSTGNITRQSFIDTYVNDDIVEAIRVWEAAITSGRLNNVTRESATVATAFTGLSLPKEVKVSTTQIASLLTLGQTVTQESFNNAYINALGQNNLLEAVGVWQALIASDRLVNEVREKATIAAQVIGNDPDLPAGNTANLAQINDLLTDNASLTRANFIINYQATAIGADSAEAITIWEALITSGRLTSVIRESATVVARVVNMNDPDLPDEIQTSLTDINGLLTTDAMLTETTFINSYKGIATSADDAEARVVWNALIASGRLTSVTRESATVAVRVNGNNPMLPTGAGANLMQVNRLLTAATMLNRATFVTNYKAEISDATDTEAINVWEALIASNRLTNEIRESATVEARIIGNDPVLLPSFNADLEQINSLLMDGAMLTQAAFITSYTNLIDTADAAEATMVWQALAASGRLTVAEQNATVVARVESNDPMLPPETQATLDEVNTLLMNKTSLTEAAFITSYKQVETTATDGEIRGVWEALIASERLSSIVRESATIAVPTTSNAPNLPQETQASRTQVDDLLKLTRSNFVASYKITATNANDAEARAVWKALIVSGRLNDVNRESATVAARVIGNDPTLPTMAQANLKQVNDLLTATMLSRATFVTNYKAEASSATDTEAINVWEALITSNRLINEIRESATVEARIISNDPVLLPSFNADLEQINSLLMDGAMLTQAAFITSYTNLIDTADAAEATMVWQALAASGRLTVAEQNATVVARVESNDPMLPPETQATLDEVNTLLMNKTSLTEAAFITSYKQIEATATDEEIRGVWEALIASERLSSVVRESATVATRIVSNDPTLPDETQASLAQINGVLSNGQILPEQAFINAYIDIITQPDVREAIAVWNALIDSDRLTSEARESATIAARVEGTNDPALPVNTQANLTQINTLLALTQAEFITAYRTAVADNSATLNEIIKVWNALVTSGRLTTVVQEQAVIADDSTTNTFSLPPSSQITSAQVNTLLAFSQEEFIATYRRLVVGETIDNIVKVWDALVASNRLTNETNESATIAEAADTNAPDLPTGTQASLTQINTLLALTQTAFISDYRTKVSDADATFTEIIGVWDALIASDRLTSEVRESATIAARVEGTNDPQLPGSVQINLTQVNTLLAFTQDTFIATYRTTVNDNSATLQEIISVWEALITSGRLAAVVPESATMATTTNTLNLPMTAQVNPSQVDTLLASLTQADFADSYRKTVPNAQLDEIIGVWNALTTSGRLSSEVGESATITIGNTPVLPTDTQASLAQVNTLLALTQAAFITAYRTTVGDNAATLDEIIGVWEALTAVRRLVNEKRERATVEIRGNDPQLPMGIQANQMQISDLLTGETITETAFITGYKVLYTTATNAKIRDLWEALTVSGRLTSVIRESATIAAQTMDNNPMIPEEVTANIMQINDLLMNETNLTRVAFIASYKAKIDTADDDEAIAAWEALIASERLTNVTRESATIATRIEGNNDPALPMGTQATLIQVNDMLINELNLTRERFIANYREVIRNATLNEVIGVWEALITSQRLTGVVREEAGIAARITGINDASLPNGAQIMPNQLNTLLTTQSTLTRKAFITAYGTIVNNATLHEIIGVWEALVASGRLTNVTSVNASIVARVVSNDPALPEGTQAMLSEVNALLMGKTTLTQTMFVTNYKAAISGSDDTEAMAVWQALVASGRLTGVTGGTATVASRITGNDPDLDDNAQVDLMQVNTLLTQKSRTTFITDYRDIINGATFDEIIDVWEALIASGRLTNVVQEEASITPRVAITNDPALPNDAQIRLDQLNVLLANAMMLTRSDFITNYRKFVGNATVDNIIEVWEALITSNRLTNVIREEASIAARIVDTNDPDIPMGAQIDLTQLNSLLTDATALTRSAFVTAYRGMVTGARLQEVIPVWEALISSGRLTAVTKQSATVAAVSDTNTPTLPANILINQTQVNTLLANRSTLTRSGFVMGYREFVSTATLDNIIAVWEVLITAGRLTNVIREEASIVVRIANTNDPAIPDDAQIDLTQLNTLLTTQATLTRSAFTTAYRTVATNATIDEILSVWEALITSKRLTSVTRENAMAVAAESANRPMLSAETKAILTQINTLLPTTGAIEQKAFIEGYVATIKPSGFAGAIGAWNALITASYLINPIRESATIVASNTPTLPNDAHSTLIDTLLGSETSITQQAFIDAYLFAISTADNAEATAVWNALITSKRLILGNDATVVASNTPTLPAGVALATINSVLLNKQKITQQAFINGLYPSNPTPAQTNTAIDAWNALLASGRLTGGARAHATVTAANKTNALNNSVLRGLSASQVQINALLVNYLETTVSPLTQQVFITAFNNVDEDTKGQLIWQELQDKGWIITNQTGYRTNLAKSLITLPATPAGINTTGNLLAVQRLLNDTIQTFEGAKIVGGKGSFVHQFGRTNGIAIWEHLVANGFIKTPSAIAYVVPVTERRVQELPVIYDNDLPNINTLLERPTIQQSITSIGFDTSLILRDGWLTLTPSPGIENP